MVDDLLPSKRPMKVPPSDSRLFGRKKKKPRNLMGYTVKLEVHGILKRNANV